MRTKLKLVNGIGRATPMNPSIVNNGTANNLIQVRAYPQSFGCKQFRLRAYDHMRACVRLCMHECVRACVCVYVYVRVCLNNVCLSVCVCTHTRRTL